MSHTVLFDEIRLLTEQAESFSQEGTVEKCPKVLEKRQKLLEELHQYYVENKSEELKKSYIELLLTIKSQDDLALKSLAEHRTAMLSSFTKQVTVKKAIHAYKHVQLNK